MAKNRSDGALVRAAEGFQHNEELPRGFDWRAFDAYLFDIDGTLANFRDRVHFESYCNAMLDIFGRPISLEGLKVHGSTDPLILIAAMQRAGIAEEDGRAEIPNILERMCSEVERRFAELRPEVCEAVPKLLAELQSGGKHLGVASGNLERIGWAKLKSAGLDAFFQFGAFSDSNETRQDVFQWGLDKVRKTLGTKAHICFIGDTPTDVQAAKACGAPVIAVATGNFSLLELAKEEPEMCIPDCQTLWRYARL